MDKTEIKEDLEKNTNDNAGIENSSANELRVEEQAPVEGRDPEGLSKLQEEVEAAKDKYLRLYSEFENFRKRTAKEKLELIQSANEQLIKALLPVADDFERAENAFPDKTDQNLAGFFLIYSKFKKTLELYGVKAMEATQGTEFNADLHDAITQIPAPNADLKGKIIDVVEKGYLLNDKVIRYAKVVVGN